ncbi:ABC transporter permease [Entomomonas asaccharolytica]|uniref:ABC transporter permease n=1 Tax=Entomomonas asaccharolytica TaxID=2785331 RepID=A0A974RWX9_9GAMM|nr:ABC transporter permease [Entomomonas asaccharolytica]QQP85671.1 ABC transporter permease [Entomomonas asaccharolytica]
MEQTLEHQQRLKKRLNKSGRKKRWISRFLVIPAIAFLVFFFLIPLGDILCKSIINPEIHKNLPTTLEALKNWDGKSTPDEEVFRALVNDLREARKQGVAGAIGRRLGYEDDKYRVMISATLRRLPAPQVTDVKSTVIKASPLWQEPSTWQTIQWSSSVLTSRYLLQSFDYKIDPQTGKLTPITIKIHNEEVANYHVKILFRTLWMSFIITFFCIVIGYPLAYWLACQPTKRANLFLILVLLPFWTSLLVRTTGWYILLQSNGLANYLLQFLNIVDHPTSFIPGRFAVYIAMIHILLPFIVLPLYAVMRGISSSHLRAAISLGAHPVYAFFTAYVPQTYAGLRAGILLVFIMAIGYYITPALLGGPADQMISYFINYYTNETNNWGLAAALSVQLMAIVIVLSWIYSKISYRRRKA